MISHRHRCIYVKVPKCASTSVLEWFAAHGGGRPSFRPAWHGGAMSQRLPGTARAMNLYPDYFTFTFLRNPWERFVSLWLDLRRVARERGGGAGGAAEDLDTLGGFAEFAAEVLADFGPCWGREAAAAFRARRGRRYGPGRIRLGDLGWSADHLWPQTAFVPDCNAARLFGVARANADPLSFIGSVGRLDEDFARLAALLDLPAAPLPRRRARGAEAGAARTRAYAAYYDGETRRLVETLYASDIEFTGCGFEDGRTAVSVPGRGSRDPGAASRPGAPGASHAAGAGVARAVGAGGGGDGAPVAPPRGVARGAPAGAAARPGLSAGRGAEAGMGADRVPGGAGERRGGLFREPRGAGARRGGLPGGCAGRSLARPSRGGAGGGGARGGRCGRPAGGGGAGCAPRRRGGGPLRGRVGGGRAGGAHPRGRGGKRGVRRGVRRRRGRGAWC